MCPRWDSNQPLPLKIRHSFENIPNPTQSQAGTAESEAQGVHIVHTLFWCECWLLPILLAASQNSDRGHIYTAAC
jgi:hypothetical protein